jgi:hypothetical protein
MICSSYEYGQRMAEIKVNGHRPTYVSVGISIKKIKSIPHELKTSRTGGY